MPCCSLKDSPSVTVRTHLPQQQQTMVTETIVALVQWQRRKHMEICKYSTVKSKGQFLQWGPVSSARPRALCCSTSTETLKPLLLLIKSSPSVTLLFWSAHPSVTPFLTKPSAPRLLAGRLCAKCLQKINSVGQSSSLIGVKGALRRCNGHLEAKPGPHLFNHHHHHHKGGQIHCVNSSGH